MTKCARAANAIRQRVTVAENQLARLVAKKRRSNDDAERLSLSRFEPHAPSSRSQRLLTADERTHGAGVLRVVQCDAPFGPTPRSERRGIDRDLDSLVRHGTGVGRHCARLRDHSENQIGSLFVVDGNVDAEVEVTKNCAFPRTSKAFVVSGLRFEFDPTGKFGASETVSLGWFPV